MITEEAPVHLYIPWDGFMLTDERTKYRNWQSGR